jgi:hypothetical protein
MLGVVWLNGCSDPVNCADNYRGGCVYAPVTQPAAAAAPSLVAPALAAPVAARPEAQPAQVVPASVGRGEPSDFADVDDKQCRSYGLTFGTRDYADCRIRLSAQHRGLDPNIGTTTSAPPSR